MSVLNQTNRTRVQKIIETLALIQKSAESNKAPDEDMIELLGPAARELEKLLPAPTVEAPAAKKVGHSQARWHQIMEWADTAPLKDLSCVVNKLAMRIEDHIYEHKD